MKMDAKRITDRSALEKKENEIRESRRSLITKKTLFNLGFGA